MAKGRTWPAEWRDYDDPLSAVHVRQLTGYKGNSHHLYFTNPGWYARGGKMLIGSDRDNRTNLFGIDLETGEIEQLTDLEPGNVAFLCTSVNPTCDEAYFRYNRSLVAVDLRTRELRTLCEMPEGFRWSMVNCTADGKHVCVGYYEDLSDRIRIDRNYIGFPEVWKAHPLSRIVKAAVDGSGAEVVWEEKTWIGHINTSPTLPNILTFCHEGPWRLVDNRIWGLDLETKKAWRIRPREGDENPGHEYWHADGVTVGYHGHRPDGSAFLGRIRYDNTGKVEYPFPSNTGHIHSNDASMIVGDGGRVIRLWKDTGDGYDGPRVLCEHRSSMHIQESHPHPRFTPDGKQVVYTTNFSGYCQVCLVDVPEFESLPPVEEDEK
ncbi:MAG TPA: oligogalacturonate lyase family protein [Planctomycetota bacterium]|nr:oligogalacturonate lyase family protein [Planctomycetota bacterium]